MTRLAEMFNVNHFIVSQVNPHVVPFLVKDEENISAEAQQGSTFSAGPTWLHSMANLAKGEALHRLHVLSELGIFPNYLTKARSILNQRYSGDINIFPSISYTQFPKVLSNPTTEYMLQCMITGERATWPRLSRVKNHVAIELALDETIRQFRTRVVFSRSQIDLRLNNFNRPVSQGNEAPAHSQNNTKPLPLSISSTATPHHSTNPRIKFPLKSTHAVKPYPPSYPPRKLSKCRTRKSLDTFSSSTNPDEFPSDEDISLESDTSDLLSSPSPPNSPSSQLPTLWPSTRQLFPSASQPTTPSISTTLYGHRNISFVNMAMTTTPSSSELRYKRLFHPSDSIAPTQQPPIHLNTQRGIENTISPLDTIRGSLPTIPHTESMPEAQNVLPATMTKADSLPEAEIRVLNAGPDYLLELKTAAALQDEAKATSSSKSTSKKPSKHDLKEAERDRRSSRRGSIHGAGFGLGLLLDISGTRGMMLRRKNSSLQGHGNASGQT